MNTLLFSAFLFLSQGLLAQAASALKVYSPAFRTSADNQQIECSEITTQVCEALWDKEHKGVLFLKSGGLKVGVLPNSEVKYTMIEDLQALLASEPRLPADLKKVWKPYFKSLKNLLNKKEYNQQWEREVSVLKYQMDNRIQDLSLDYAETKFKNIKKIPKDKRTFEQHLMIREKLYALKNDILDAKYKQHPNWLKIESIFTEVKTDLLNQIALLPYEPQFKQIIHDKLNTVQLTLPYEDPRRIGADESCGETENNAFYYPDKNIFTVCAGDFNSKSNFGNLYATMAHELSHSIDPENLIEDRLSNESIIAKNLEAISRDIKSVSCEDWNTMLKQRREKTVDMQPAIAPQLPQLVSCLGDHSKLEPWDAKTARDVAKSYATRWVGGGADKNAFLEMIQPVINEEGEQRPNEYYLNPDLAMKRNQKYVGSNAQRLGPKLSHVFVKNLLCLPEYTGRYDELLKTNSALKNNEFKSLIEVSSEIMKFHSEDSIRFSGKTDNYMIRNKMSVSTSELFADWMAYRALGNKLSRMTDINDRRETAALAVMYNCTKPSINSTAKELSATQKEFSQEPHPERSLRMQAVFTKRIAELLNCKPAAKPGRLSSCEP